MLKTYAPRGTGDDTTIVEGLKNEVQVLKSRCSMLEKTANVLQSICDTHERTLETVRKHILILHRQQGTLDSSYQGEEFEVIL